MPEPDLDMITRCFRHQWPQLYGRPEIADLSLDEIYGPNRPREYIPERGPSLPPADPGYPGALAVPETVAGP